MSNKTYRIGIAGMTHGHIGAHLREWQRLENATLVGYAETDPELRAKYAERLSGAAAYDSIEQLFDEARPDVISVCNETINHVTVVEAAAARGIHCIMEKPMAISLQQAQRMVVAATKSGIQVIVNWPTHWGSQNMLKSLRLIQDGAIGRLYEVRHRGGSTKPTAREADAFFRWLYQPAINGAGAYADYCGYGIDMALSALGIPSSVWAITGRYVREDLMGDDNARMILQYPRALAMVEATWTQVGVPHGATAFYGDRGTLELRPEGIWHATLENQRGAILDKVPALDYGASAMEYMLRQLDRDEPVADIFSVRRGRDTAEVFEAGLLSARTGQIVVLPLPVLP
jgi:predicted dehydrogenase